MSSILIIDDDSDILDALKVLLEDEFDEVIIENKQSRIAALVGARRDVILLDMNFSAGVNTGNEGLFWLAKILEANPQSNVVMMTAYGNISLAVEAIKRGAKDFVLKPWENDKLLSTLRAVVKIKKPSREREPLSSSIPGFMEGKSKAMIGLQEQMKKVASTEASILLLGENGTGKEMIARELHRLSARSRREFIPVDLSAISANLFESELFGHKKGSFTDARTDHQGRFEMANGGTLFLDEIGNLPLAQQAKLLTVLQNRVILPVGANTSVPLDVRLISATNAPLSGMISQGQFRQDLLYRLNTITLEIPPLRERGEDILALAEYFLEKFSRQYNKPDIVLTDAAKNEMLDYPWPGNVRELQHTIEKAVILSNGNTINIQDLSLSISSKTSDVRQPNSEIKTLDVMEREALQQALINHAGNIVQAAKALGITRQTFYNKMKKYGL